MDKTLAFEITCITLLLSLGTTLLAHGLPGGSLIGVAVLLALGAGGLRLINARHRTPESRALQPCALQASAG